MPLVSGIELLVKTLDDLEHNLEAARIGAEQGKTGYKLDYERLNVWQGKAEMQLAEMRADLPDPSEGYKRTKDKRGRYRWRDPRGRYARKPKFGAISYRKDKRGRYRWRNRLGQYTSKPEI